MMCNTFDSLRVSALFLFASLLLPLTQAQVANIGPCPKSVQTLQTFDPNLYLGRWYEYSKYPFIFEMNGKCIYAEYGLLPSGDISVYNSNIDITTNLQNDISGTAQVTGPGKLSVTFSSTPAFVGGADYWVLDTDYENYAAVYSCTDLGFLHTKVIWILTRERIPDAQSVQNAENAIKAQNLSLQPMEKTIQQNCGAH